jgi:hypothetical protein
MCALTQENPMISPDFESRFKYDAACNVSLKHKVKEYISGRYEPSKLTPISVYSICVGFQMVIGSVPQSAVAYWLGEWGYHVTPSKCADDWNYSVFIKLKDKFSK